VLRNETIRRTAEPSARFWSEKVQGLLQECQREIARKTGKTCRWASSRESNQVLIIEQHRAILSIAYSCIASAVNRRVPGSSPGRGANLLSKSNKRVKRQSPKRKWQSHNEECNDLGKSFPNFYLCDLHFELS
jgi:hypothetical protein